MLQLGYGSYLKKVPDPAGQKSPDLDPHPWLQLCLEHLTCYSTMKNNWQCRWNCWCLWLQSGPSAPVISSAWSSNYCSLKITEYFSSINIFLWLKLCSKNDYNTILSRGSRDIVWKLQLQKKIRPLALCSWLEWVWPIWAPAGSWMAILSLQDVLMGAHQWVIDRGMHNLYEHNLDLFSFG